MPNSIRVSSKEWIFIMSNEEFQHIGYLLSRASLARRNIIDRQLSALGIHRGQPPVLFVLQEHDGMSNSEMSEFLGITPATLTNKIKRMEKAGLVIRESDPVDKRFICIYMTEKSRGIMEQLRASIEEIEDNLLIGFSKEEISLLWGLMQRMLDNVHRYYSEMDRFPEHPPRQDNS